jgi:hypothetical protein
MLGIKRKEKKSRLYIGTAESKNTDVLNSHIASYEEYITDALCTLLKHPRKCPHAHNIPLGKCCFRK